METTHLEIRRAEVVTRSFGAALHLYGRGHAVHHVHSRDGSLFNCYFYFEQSARADLEEYYRKRDELNTVHCGSSTRPIPRRPSP
jgi:hypothetical protein